MADHEHEHELMVPFVVCQSQGGPFEDHAFVNGCRYTELRHRVSIWRPLALVSFENPDLRPQLELLAMEFGYELTTEPHDEDWEKVTFSISTKESK
jgi:hypothetical protein